MADASDRTIPATPRRREQARRQGFMPLAGLPAWVATVATTLLLLPAWAQATFTAATAMMREAVRFRTAGLESPHGFDLLPPAAVVLPTVALVAVAGAVALSVRLLLDGATWQPARLLPSFDRISPLGGLARICSLATLASLAGHAIGLALLVAVAVVSSRPLVRLVGSGGPPREPAEFAGAIQETLLPLLAVAGLVVASIWAVERLRFERRIRMTPQEHADESRSTQSDPKVRWQRAGHGRQA